MDERREASCFPELNCDDRREGKEDVLDAEQKLTDAEDGRRRRSRTRATKFLNWFGRCFDI